jgi:hypothetical protein
MVGGEITAMIGVKRRRDPSDPPLRHGFPPQRVAQDQGRVETRGGLQAQSEAGNGPTVIIHNDGEPWPSRWAPVLPHPEIQQGVIGLPEVIRLLGFTAVQEIVGRPGGVAAVMGEGDQGGARCLTIR